MVDASERPTVQELLGKAIPAPREIHTQDGGAVLALAVHCKPSAATDHIVVWDELKSSGITCSPLFVFRPIRASWV